MRATSSPQATSASTPIALNARRGARDTSISRGTYPASRGSGKASDRGSTSTARRRLDRFAAMAGSRAAPGRLLSIDILKGLAALWVLLIHADALAGSVAMVYVFNRAAPIFVVLIGVNGEFWWTGKDWSALTRWFGQRLRRLYVPMWWAV